MSATIQIHDTGPAVVEVFPADKANQFSRPFAVAIIPYDGGTVRLFFPDADSARVWAQDLADAALHERTLAAIKAERGAA